MRFVLTAMIALALGLLPAGTARAQAEPAPLSTAMSCHDMGGDVPAHDSQDTHDDGPACADHCLSQVNGQPQVARLSGPALQNAIAASLATDGDVSKPRLRDPPDPPPPRN